MVAAYILCGTPRSGSTLLCQMLAASGVAGRPNSFYREPDITHWADQWGVPHPDGIEDAVFDRRYLDAMLERTRSPGSAFGLRLMWGSVSEAQRRLDRALGGTADIAARFEQAFGPVRYVHLSRRDKVAQAVSLVRAEQSGLWHMGADGAVLEGAETLGPIRYDGARLSALVAELESDDTAWNSFFATRAIKPLRLTYETVTADPRRALADILDAVGLDAGLAQAVEVRTARMADETSREWAARFRREAHRDA